MHACDKYTKEFYEKLKQPQSENFELKKDSFVSKVLSAYEPKPFYGLNSYIYNGRVTPQKQFFENDRKVLKFFAEFENSPYIIHYYLSNDSLEVCQVNVPNSGKDAFPTMVRKQKIPRKYQVHLPG